MERRFWLGAAGLFFLVALAVAARILPHDATTAYAAGLTASGDPVGPSAAFWLGADVAGRDELSRLAAAASISLLLGAGAGIAATALGTAVGATAGLAANRPSTHRLAVAPEALLMRGVDVMLAIPPVLLAFALVAPLGRGVPLIAAVIVATCWTSTARIVFWRVAAVVRAGFVEAARAVGVSQPRILVRHVMPHVLPVVVVFGALSFANAVLLEATLSFLGVGLDPTESPSWGAMIYEDSGWFATRPLLMLAPGLAIVVAVLSLTLIADALADRLDPTARWRGGRPSSATGRQARHALPHEAPS